MSVYSRYILPKLTDLSCSVKPITRQREKIVPLAEGRVLEIGVGSGLNLAHYDRSRIDSIIGLDASEELMARALERARTSGVPFEPLLLDAKSIPLEDNAVDTVLVTYSLCSIDALGEALSEMRRVLKPAGRLLFCEHGLAPDAGVQKLQNRLTPVWKRVGGGCRLNRDLPKEIAQAGFRITALDQMYLPGTWRFIGFNSWGTAQPA
jgi:ubiquinone/menaquinone biosynthesis C-methylase UbiE